MVMVNIDTSDEFGQLGDLVVIEAVVLDQRQQPQVDAQTVGGLDGGTDE